MKKIALLDASSFAFDIGSDFRVGTRERKPGPPERVDAMTINFVNMDHDAPHGGEVHPDGDEILIVISGRIAVTADSYPDDIVEVGPGQACIVPKGECHKVSVIEKVQMVAITPGPNGDHRPQ